MTLISTLTRYIIIFFFLLVILLIVLGGIAYYLLKIRKITSREEQFDYSKFDRRDSVEFVRFEQIINAVIRGTPTKDGIIVYDDGNRFVAGINVYGFNYFSASAQEQYSSISSMISFLNTIEKDVQYRQSTRAIDLKDNIEQIEEKIEEVNAEIFAINEERKNMLEVIESYKHEPKTFSMLEKRILEAERTIHCKTHTVDELEEMVNYMGIISDNNYETERVQSWFIEWEYNANEYTDALTEEEKYEKAAEALSTKYIAFSNALSSTGCTCERMTGDDLMECFRHHYMPETADLYKMSDIYQSSYNSLYVSSNVLEELKENIKQEEIIKEYYETLDDMRELAKSQIRNDVEVQVRSNIKEEDKLISFEGIDNVEEDDIVYNEPTPRSTPSDTDADEDDESMVLTDDTEDDFSFADEEDLSQLSLDFDDEE